jgi:hypothetical protein
VKQIGIRMLNSEYESIKALGRVLSMVQIFPLELNDSELFSLLINYAWKVDRQNSELKLKTGIINFNTMDNFFKSVFGETGKPLNFMAESLNQVPINKTLVLDDDTNAIVIEASKIKDRGSISETVKILTLSTVRDVSANINLMAWFLAFEVYTKSCIDHTSGKVKTTDLKSDLIHIQVPDKISIYPYDKKNFHSIIDSLLKLRSYATARGEAFTMEKLGREMGVNFLGNFTSIANREGEFKYPRGFSAHVGMANWFWVNALPYMAVRKLFTSSLISSALRTKKQNMAPFVEVQESEILDILAEKLVKNEISLDSEYEGNYNAFMKWMDVFEKYIEKNVFES